MQVYDLAMIAVVIAFVLLAGAITFGLVADARERNELIAECVHDGRKQYECAAMFKECSSATTVVPMPVIIGR